jgi:uncharacterized protein (TIGR04255 family)
MSIDFENPPVIETVIGLQFECLEATSLQIGLVWSEFRDKFAVVEEQAELDPVIERFDGLQRPSTNFRFVPVSPRLRFWFVNNGGDELVQVQKDRFFRNWRKSKGTEKYPRYEVLRNSFLADLTRFSRFVETELKQSLVPNQCEVSYINIIETDKPGDLSQVLTCLDRSSKVSVVYPPELAVFNLKSVLTAANGEPWGRIHIEAGTAINETENKAVVRLSLTARGKPDEPTLESAMNVLDKCHEAENVAFLSITTEEMQKKWGRK